MNSCGVVPESLPHFTELPVAEFTDELEARSVNLPLVASRVGQVGGHWLLHLK